MLFVINSTIYIYTFIDIEMVMNDFINIIHEHFRGLHGFSILQPQAITHSFYR